jgi:predicted TIM-barrel fold metal-dependent hydrolase
MKLIGFTFYETTYPILASLEKAWRPYIETCIEAFGPQARYFPVDKGTCSYQVLSRTYKRIATWYSADEKKALFSETASQGYRLTV